MLEPRAMYVIYANPTDHPGKVIVRRWNLAGQDMKPAWFHAEFNTVEEARASIPTGHICFPRHVDDHQCVVETWL